MEIKNFSAKLCALLGMLLVTIGSTYGIFTTYQEGQQEHIITSANLVIVLDDKDSVGIHDTNAVPVSDEVALSKVPYLFALKNTGTIGAHYEIKLVADTKAIATDACASNLLADASIKYQLIRDGVELSRGLLSELNGYVIDSGEIANGKIYNYQLRIWIPSTAANEVMGRHYHGKIIAEMSDARAAS